MRSLIILFVCIVGVAFAQFESLTQVTGINWARVSSDYEDTDLPGTLAIDNNFQTHCHSGKQDQPYLELYFPFSNISYIQIFNRLDPCCINRLLPFYIALTATPFTSDYFTVAQLQAIPSVYMQRVDGPGDDPSQPNYMFNIPIPDIPARGLRIITTNLNTWLHITEVRLYKMKIITPVASAVSTVYPDQNWPSQLAHDGNLNTHAHTDNEANSDPWIELQFPASRVCRIVVWNRVDCCQARINPFSIILKASPFTTRTPNPILYEDYKSLETPIQYFDVPAETKPYYHLIFSHVNPFTADRLRLFQKGGGYLNVAEIKVYGCDPILKRNEIPLPLNYSEAIKN